MKYGSWCLKIGTWNVRTLNKLGKFENLIEEATALDVDALSIYLICINPKFCFLLFLNQNYLWTEVKQPTPVKPSTMLLYCSKSRSTENLQSKYKCHYHRFSSHIIVAPCPWLLSYKCNYELIQPIKKISISSFTWYILILTFFIKFYVLFS